MTVDPTIVPGRDECVSGLLGAYLLGACTVAEADVVETHLGRCPVCSADAAQLALAVPPPSWAAIVGPDDEPAPVGSGSLDAVLTAALAVRPAAPGTVVPAESHPARAVPAEAVPAWPRGLRAPAYGSRAATLDRLLVEMAAADWGLPTVAGWPVRELVLHLYAVDGLVLAALGGARNPGSDSPGDLERPDEDPVTRTEVVLAATRGWSAEQVRRRWYERATLLCAAVADTAGAGAAEGGAAEGGAAPVVTAGGWTATAADHLTARGFETWIHTRDIAAATGLLTPDPGGDELHTMADLALRLLAAPWAAAMAPEGPAALSVTLTGPGGSTWSMDPSGVRERRAGGSPLEPVSATGGPPTAGTAGPAAGRSGGLAATGTVTAEIIPFCLLAGARTTVETMTTRVEGDERLAAELLALTPSLARP